MPQSCQQPTNRKVSRSAAPFLLTSRTQTLKLLMGNASIATAIVRSELARAI
jgi:hypothetical protein